MVGLLATAKQEIAAYIRSLVLLWDAFWFQPEDPLTLGLLRIVTGLMLCYTHLVWGLKLDAFFGPEGFQDPLLVQILEPDSTAWTFWWYVADAYRAEVHWGCFAILALYTLGLWTTVTKWAALVITISYANRAPNANFGLDQFNAMLAFYLALGPCGARLSLDRLLQVRRAGVRSLREQGGWSVPAVLPSSTTRLATRLIQIHMCVVYFFAGVSKLKGDAWWDGKAVWMALANTEYQTGDMTWIAWFPWVSDIATHTTILWEMTFWFFVWKPASRPWVLLVGTAMHLGIGAFLGMWTFGLIMMFTYFSYMPPEKLRMVGAWLALAIPKPVPIQVKVYRDCWENLQLTAWRKALDWRQRLQLVIAEPQVIDSPILNVPDVKLVTCAEWWATHKWTVSGWPFAACDRLDVSRPRIIIVHALVDSLAALQNYFQGKGFDCRAVRDIPGACEALFDRPTDVLLLLGQSPHELDDLLRFRNLLHHAQAHAPASVTMVSRVPDDAAWVASPEHQLMTGPATPRELRAQVNSALQERTCTVDEAKVLVSSLRKPATDFSTPPPVATIADIAHFLVE